MTEPIGKVQGNMNQGIAGEGIDTYDDPWKIPRYSSGEAVMTSDHIDSMTFSPEHKNISRNESVVIKTLRRINTEKNVKRRKSTPKKKVKSKTLKRTKSMRSPSSKRLKIVDGKIDHDSAWSRFGLSTREKGDLLQTRHRLNNKIFQIRKDVKTIVGKFKLRSIKKKENKKAKKMRSYLSGNAKSY